MIHHLENNKIAMVGGGRFCEKLLRHVLSDHFKGRQPTILGVADINENAAGISYARSLNIFTCSDYREICNLEGLDTIIEVTWDLELAREIARIKPAGVELINHQDSRFLWDLLQLEAIREDAFAALETEKLTAENARERINRCFRKTAEIVMQRNRRFKQIENELYEKEKSLSQIVQGSTIPTFVINRDHVVTHWNHALEKLTGYTAEQIVGTRDHWRPFRKEERPIMADVILDQLETGEINHYYGSRWQPSTLIEGGFEAEEFFEHIGGKRELGFFYGRAHQSLRRHDCRRRRNPVGHHRAPPGRKRTPGLHPAHRSQRAHPFPDYSRQRRADLCSQPGSCDHPLEPGPGEAHRIPGCPDDRHAAPMGAVLEQ